MFTVNNAVRVVVNAETVEMGKSELLRANTETKDKGNEKRERVRKRNTHILWANTTRAYQPHFTLRWLGFPNKEERKCQWLLRITLMYCTVQALRDHWIWHERWNCMFALNALRTNTRWMCCVEYQRKLFWKAGISCTHRFNTMQSRRLLLQFMLDDSIMCGTEKVYLICGNFSIQIKNRPIRNYVFVFQMFTVCKIFLKGKIIIHDLIT